MKRNSILLCLLFAITANLITPAAKAQVNTTDSLALVDLYHSTNGPNWYHHTNWLTANPVSTWKGVTVTTNRVTALKLEYNYLSGSLPSTIGNLTSLNSLDLSSNYMGGNIPLSIGNLINLTHLDLSSNQLTGIIPAEIGNLNNLTYLSFSLNQLTDTIPAEIGNLVNLTVLYLQFNQLSGTIPAEIRNLTNLIYLQLNDNHLIGIIPVTLGNLTNLTILNLDYNSLSGSIPATLGNLTKLSYLNLYHNQLSGTIPATIDNLINLTFLDLSFNQLSGSIPADIGNLKKLTQLEVNSNQLSGAIPASIGKLINIQFLGLSTNQLSGAIPFSLHKLKNAYDINLSYNKLSQFGDAHSSTNINSKTKCYINNNLFTFDGLQFIASNYHNVFYAPQDTILPIHQNGNTLSVSAGGTVSNNTYTWYKMGSTNGTTIKGNLSFTPSSSGQYYAYVTNGVAKRLTLYSDTISYTMPLTQTKVMAVNVADVKTSSIHFSIYPNPASSIIHIQTTGTTTITLTNSAGKILLTKTINNTADINVSTYANGVYYIQNKTTGETLKVVVIH